MKLAVQANIGSQANLVNMSCMLGFIALDRSRTSSSSWRGSGLHTPDAGILPHFPPVFETGW